MHPPKLAGGVPAKGEPQYYVRQGTPFGTPQHQDLYTPILPSSRITIRRIIIAINVLLWASHGWFQTKTDGPSGEWARDLRLDGGEAAWRGCL